MTNSSQLKAKIDESGFKLRFVAQKLGLSYQGFQNKLMGKSDFKASEIVALRQLLQLSIEEEQSIFFAAKVDKKSTR